MDAIQCREYLINPDNSRFNAGQTYGKLLVARHHQQSQLCTYQSCEFVVSNMFTPLLIPRLFRRSGNS